MPKKETLLKVGDRAPHFTLNNYLGEPISLPQILSQGRTLLLFFRGTWCPNCRTQLLSLNKEVETFKQTSTQLVGIFCQKSEPVKQWAETNGIRIPLLIDADRMIAKQYGVYIRLALDSFNISRPANFLVDIDGTIKFIYVSSHQFDRCATDELITQAKKLA